MRVAIVHDWLTGMRGGEKCLEVFCELFPHADLYTLVYEPDRVSPLIRSMKIHASWLNRLPWVHHYYRYCLPLFPSTVERFELKGYDLVLSSSHCAAKGVVCPGALHIAYIHSLMRYVWDQHDAYFGVDSPWHARLGMALWRTSLQRWDTRSAARVHLFVANSKNIAGKIERLYNRTATVIYPPVDLDRFYPQGEKGSYYLVVSAFVPYKRLDLAISAFSSASRPLKVVGQGPEEKRLRRLAGPTVEFLGEKSDVELAQLYAGCRALIFPGEEDLGIVMLEAQASGKPVVAYGKGGVLETVIPLNPPEDGAAGNNPKTSGADSGATGVFFYQQTASALIEAVKLFEENERRFKIDRLRSHAAKFSREVFRDKIRSFINEHGIGRKEMAG